MKLSSTMKYALAVIARRSTGKGRRGLLCTSLQSYGINAATVRALQKRGLVRQVVTRYGTGYRMVAKATKEGQKALRSFTTA